MSLVSSLRAAPAVIAPHARALSTAAPFVGHFINGKQTQDAATTFDNINPATGQVDTRVAQGDASDVDAAVKAASEAFPEWSAMPAQERGRLMVKAGTLLRERAHELAKVEVRDTGKPFSEALYGDLPSGWESLEYYGGIAATLAGQHVDCGNGNFAYTRREPLGVVGGIGAWNYPFQIVCWKSAPALACGNTVVYKPSELTPLNAIHVAEAFVDAGIPKGVMNVVQGDRATGQAIVSHPGIKKITFTGEVGTGKAIMRNAADTLKHVTFELGGKSPLLIFDDCNLNNAVEGALKANFYSQGEVCSNGTRVFVQEGIYDEFVRRLVERTQSITVGNPMDENTVMGALISEDHLGKVLSYIEIGKSEGANLMCGGHRVEGMDGFFMRPAIFTGVEDSMRLAKEEIFGPVISILKFKTEEEAVARANDCEFGLAAGLFTTDLTRAHRVCAKFEAGTCYINNFNVAPVTVPFGGYKNSGIGRENGVGAIEHFSQIKTVHVEMNDIEFP